MTKINSKITYQMSLNENMLGPSALSLSAIQKVINNVNHYGELSIKKFQSALARHFSNQLTADQFIIANSGVELLDMLSRLFLTQGKEAIMCSPTFLLYKKFTLRESASLVDVPLDNNYQIDVKAVLDAVNENTSVLFICNPNNPTGSFFSKNVMDELLLNLPNHVTVIYDEVYHDFCEQAPFPFAYDYIEHDLQIIGMRSFSKAYGLAGLRLGYGYASKALATKINQSIDRPYLINSLSMAAGLAALEDAEHLANTKAMVREGKQFIYTEFDKLNISYHKSEGNFIFFKTELDHRKVIEFLAINGIAIQTMTAYDAPGYLRVTIGTKQANEAFISALSSLL